MLDLSTEFTLAWRYKPKVFEGTSTAGQSRRRTSDGKAEAAPTEYFGQGDYQVTLFPQKVYIVR